jgi:hypothetical protein
MASWVGAWNEERRIMGSDWRVRLQSDEDAFVVSLVDKADEIRYARKYDYLCEAADAYVHPFADEAVPTPWQKPSQGAAVVALAEAVAQEYAE